MLNWGPTISTVTIPKMNSRPTLDISDLFPRISKRRIKRHHPAKLRTSKSMNEDKSGRIDLEQGSRQLYKSFSGAKAVSLDFADQQIETNLAGVPTSNKNGAPVSRSAVLMNSCFRVIRSSPPSVCEGRRRGSSCAGAGSWVSLRRIHLARCIRASAPTSSKRAQRARDLCRRRWTACC